MHDAADIQLLKKKIDDLNAEAWKLRLEDSEKAFKLSLESIALSTSIDYKPGMAMGALVKGYYHMRQSENDQALQSLNESLDLFKSLDELKGQAEAIEYLSVVWRNLGQIERSLHMSFDALAISKQLGYTEKEASNNYQLGVTYKRLGNFDKALEYLYHSLEVIKVIDNDLYRSYSINMIGTIYFENEDYAKALEYFDKSRQIRHKFGDKWGEAGSLDYIGYCHLKLKNFDEALNYIGKSLAINNDINDKRGRANILIHLAELYDELGERDKAREYANESIELRKSFGDKRGQAEVLLLLADVIAKQNNNTVDNVIALLEEVLTIAGSINATDIVSKARYQLYQYHKSQGNYRKALQQLELHNSLEIILNKNAVSQKIASLEITNKAEEAKKEALAAKIKNDELTILNKEINDQKTKLESTLASLQATQAQLIQSEKMASLGELTAGIAHEIQNPLNFVNNFSEVNKELISELVDEVDKGNTEEVKLIAGDIKDNSEKINHHGKRADAIVKGMLQHSRSSSGQKEPTDINALCDEYLRLSYHGLRAKDNSFNAMMKTDFDESIGKISVVPQDIGRVLLNLINNAFYAVDEKKKQVGDVYEPTVTVSTKKLKDTIEINVKDNGNGIADSIKEKIFQPFFTTKPTGQGTGLGLSLVYEIIKAYDGEISISSIKNEKTEVLLQLPMS